jgi:hypothetical protein
MRLSLCHFSCVPKGHLLEVSGEVFWLIVKLCGGTYTRASTAMCHGNSTCSLCTIQNLLLHRNTCFLESHINLEYYHLHITHVAKFVEFSGGTFIWWSTCPNAGDYYINRNWVSGKEWCTHIDTWQLMSTPFIHLNGFHWLACFAKLEFIQNTCLWWVFVILL